MSSYDAFAGIYDEWATHMEEPAGLVDVAGLEVEALYGWFDRRPFDEQGPEFVRVARCPA